MYNIEFSEAIILFFHLRVSDKTDEKNLFVVAITFTNPYLILLWYHVFSHSLHLFDFS